MRIVVVGLTLSSSWGNGHAVTYRALLRAMMTRGHDILFLEADRPWYASHRDLPSPDFCTLRLFRDMSELVEFAGEVSRADAVIVGSYVPDGTAVCAWAQHVAKGVTAFYDIDTPVTLAALARGDCTYLSASQIPEFDFYLSFTGGPMLRRIERFYGARRAEALYCSADPIVHAPAEAPVLWDLSYLGTYSTDRQPSLDRLLLEAARRSPDARFIVAGPQYPSCLEWPRNVERVEHLAPADHAGFYASSRWTLNVTRANMVACGYSPSVRLFEAAACATPVISDSWMGLETVFRPNDEIVVARETEDVLRALAMPEEARREIGTTARARVTADHTPDHRAAALEEWIGLALAARRIGSGQGNSDISRQIELQPAD